MCCFIPSPAISASKAVAVLMTGMGEDGAAGMGAIQAAGGVTLAQSPDTCVVDSMPRSAITRGFASRVVSLSNTCKHSAGKMSSAIGRSRPSRRLFRAVWPPEIQVLEGDRHETV